MGRGSCRLEARTARAGNLMLPVRNVRCHITQYLHAALHEGINSGVLHHETLPPALQLASGAVYCQLVDAYYPDAIPISKVSLSSI